MKVGIWCDYGVTLGPTEGIGVFVDNLARGLVRSDPDTQVLLVAHPGEENVLDSVQQQGLGRIQVTSPILISKADKYRIKYLRKLLRALEIFGAKNSKLWSSVSNRVERLIKEQNESTRAIISSADVWLVPYVGLNQDFHRPHVVVVHDLVCYHFPEMLTSRQMRKLQRLVDKRVADATFVACMSQFIRSSDLKGILNLPDDRIRVVKAAVPDECGSDPATMPLSDSTNSLDSIIPSEPFLLFPSAFRKYKNHRILIEFASRLKELKLESMKIVFTGNKKCPRWLRKFIDQYDARDSILILGNVPRKTLHQLYRAAFATVVPSLYEQGSFPLLEALKNGCPAISSDIPSLREQFQGMADDMIFFDPYNTESLADAIRLVQEDRSLVIAKQQASFAYLKQRTWTDAARDWLLVLSDAVKQDGSSRNLTTNKVA